MSAKLVRMSQISSTTRVPVALSDLSFFWTYMDGSKSVSSSLSSHHSTDESWGALSSSLPCNLIATMRYTGR